MKIAVHMYYAELQHYRPAMFISVRGRGAGGAAVPPSRGENSIIRAKLMYRLYLMYLIYLFSPRNSPNLLKLPPSRR